MVKSKLTQLCECAGVPRKKVDRARWDFYGTQKFSEDYLVQSMVEINNFLEGNVIVIGGFCACSQLLGYRKMRRTSNDLDCVINEDGFRLLVKHFNGQIFQNPDFGDLFLEYNNIPVGFDIDKTHNWKIPQEFIDDARKFNFPLGDIKSISPEFLIALKARRSIMKKNFYGKDAIDTANVILAPYHKQGVQLINIPKLADLFREHSADSFGDLREYLSFVESYHTHLKKSEKDLFMREISSIKNSSERAYVRVF